MPQPVTEYDDGQLSRHSMEIKPRSMLHVAHKVERICHILR
jgi:hypothetical protein